MKISTQTLERVFSTKQLCLVPYSAPLEQKQHMWTTCGRKTTLLGLKTPFWAQNMSFLVFCSKIRFFNFFPFFHTKTFRNAFGLSKDLKKMQNEQKLMDERLN
jgi:hypothetical protein